MKQIITTILIVAAIFTLASYLKKGDEMAIINHDMVESCTNDMASNPNLVCD